jgi:hypothetical protein
VPDEHADLVRTRELGELQQEPELVVPEAREHPAVT